MDKTNKSGNSVELSSKKGQSVSRRNLLKTGSAVVAGTAKGVMLLPVSPQSGHRILKMLPYASLVQEFQISTKSQSVPNKTLVLLCR